ncbi:MAG: penicillin-insensitive murein endopeptidase [Myxococcales bacterium]|nr:penicillin-insensitive murein endopeptidase [Myxococcales bacterium]
MRAHPTSTSMLMAATLLLAGEALAGPAGWAAFRSPASGRAEAIGGYAGGCLVGAVALPESGPGFTSIRRHRHRFFGHPALAEFVERFGEAVVAAGLDPVLVGDLSQPRGGRMPSGHRSHQVGLDADVWFGRPAPKKRARDGNFPTLVDARRERVDRTTFGPRHVKLLRMAAEDDAVARIFVNWVIKKELCATVEGDRRWLRKVRPWFGHDRHFHVRLECPEGSPECASQAPIPPGDGCGQETWFSRAEVLARKKAAATAKPRARGARPGLPLRCRQLLAEGGGGGKAKKARARGKARRPPPPK